MIETKPVAVQQGTMTLLPKLHKLILDNTGTNPAIEVTWSKKIVETGDLLAQQPLTLSSELMALKFPDGFVRYNPITGESIPNAPKISQEEMMLFVYSVFKSIVTTDLTTDVDPDVPEGELIADDEDII